ncbi:prenyltransferase/squalene oxidase repeat-containing protein [Stieleria varia]|uniref:Prenyltransferase and squalene oxidase repeat protein n=2 Tax=Stieleria varia TaxID=2528005 RepID=A0A5C6AEG5_9BACT|nr:Prenyltransferase and squalene oxidase repeat protein [Stieleria varia]
MWPLDVSLVALSSLVLFLVVSRLRLDDERWLFNAWTYIIGVPAVALAMAFALRGLTSRYVQKTIQLGFLFSVCVHLLLLILAINVVIFTSFQPHASNGEQPKRSPIRKTVPEHLFQSPKETAQTPDWSKPVEAATTSPVVPKEQRQLPPVERTQPRLEMPKPRQLEKQPMQKFLTERQQPTSAQPMPADSPGKLAKRPSQNNEPVPANTPVEAPSVPSDATAPAKAAPTERALADNPSSSTSRRAPTQLEPLAAMSVQTPTPTNNTTPTAASRSQLQSMPTIGDAGMSRQRQARSRPQQVAVAGAAPAPMTVAVARSSDDASLMLAPVEIPMNRTGKTQGAQITTGESPSFSAESSPSTSPGSADIARNALAARAGVPDINSGNAARAPGRSRRANVASGFSPIGAPTPNDALAASSTGTSGQGSVDQLDDRMGTMDMMAERSENSGGSTTPELSAAGAPSLALDLMAELGPVGLSNEISKTVGVVPSEDQPEIAALELSRDARPKRNVGGPATPAGTKIAAVESFSRRVMRTSGGAAPSPPGLGGPATEEAIERGLAFLASVQNEDGSWSLQGHGDPVLLRSDSAATGLCLLAFQGAGYTHQQHQYATTVSKGLKFLIDNQRTNGDLYRSENEVSDRNVAFYSHGIAALAMSEAYGMTQDPELRPAAQAALSYIIETQHHKRGGWRYTPQVSSDTSVTGWMMMALKSGELAGLEVPQATYDGIDKWLDLARESPERLDRYRYNPYAPDTPQQRHGRVPSRTMTAVGMLMRMYNGWSRENPAMQSAADYLLQYPPQLGEKTRPRRDGYYWYYATQVMFHMGGEHWDQWNRYLNPLLLETQIKSGPEAGSWDPELPVPDRWSAHAGRLYVTTMNLLNLEVYYRHLPIYEDTAAE